MTSKLKEQLCLCANRNLELRARLQQTEAKLFEARRELKKLRAWHRALQAIGGKP
jgi:hypothetical protein